MAPARSQPPATFMRGPPLRAGNEKLPAIYVPLFLGVTMPSPGAHCLREMLAKVPPCSSAPGSLPSWPPPFLGHGDGGSPLLLRNRHPDSGTMGLTCRATASAPGDSTRQSAATWLPSGGGFFADSPAGDRWGTMPVARGVPPLPQRGNARPVRPGPVVEHHDSYRTHRSPRTAGLAEDRETHRRTAGRRACTDGPRGSTVASLQRR